MPVTRQQKQKRRQTKKDKKQRGGGTALYAFAPSTADATMNNAAAWAPAGCGAGAERLAPHVSGGLPGMRGGGGGAHYGNTGSIVNSSIGPIEDGLFGGAHSIPSNCALPAAQLNVRGGELWSQAGGGDYTSPTSVVHGSPSPVSLNIAGAAAQTGASPMSASTASDPLKGGKRNKKAKSKSKSKYSKRK